MRTIPVRYLVSRLGGKVTLTDLFSEQVESRLNAIKETVQQELRQKGVSRNFEPFLDFLNQFPQLPRTEGSKVQYDVAWKSFSPPDRLFGKSSKFYASIELGYDLDSFPDFYRLVKYLSSLKTTKIDLEPSAVADFKAQHFIEMESDPSTRLVLTIKGYDFIKGLDKAALTDWKRRLNVPPPPVTTAPPRQVKDVTRTDTFKQWYDNADMPELVDGEWVDLETGLPFNPSPTRDTHLTVPLSPEAKSARNDVKADGAKALKGTPKQVNWAETIRAKVFKTANERQRKLLGFMSMFGHAKFWIENRFDSNIPRKAEEAQRLVKQINAYTREAESEVTTDSKGVITNWGNYHEIEAKKAALIKELNRLFIK